ncbi:MAG: lytic transglycosylase domain-containing protein, partial [Sandaracinaceae bacterium]|nr:lytic transglycosylase domain-containing protein [Sandaracinaceae bacterium]
GQLDGERVEREAPLGAVGGVVREHAPHVAMRLIERDPLEEGVESVYNPRIISYAGAIGLMQIMPRTGRLIAHAMERDDFTIDQLLLPEVNIEMAAWYLRSLIDRFEGRVPLAIAAYNGGPHNVRRWMRDHASAMPLDAFLERIPFDQTHRYVRRVLTHYAAYRAQRGLALDPLSVELPPEATDTVAF